MAPNAVNRRPGHLARAIHWLFPSRTGLAISIAVEIGLTVCGLPLRVHLALGAVAHLLVAEVA